MRRENPVLVGRLSVPIESAALHASLALAKLGYGPSVSGHDKNGLWLVQEAAGGLQSYAAFCGDAERSRTRPRLPSASPPTPTTRTRSGRPSGWRLRALRQGYSMGEAFESTKWWQAFWDVSSVRVPDPKIQAQYDLAMYLYGAGAKRGAPPIPLQGLWTADDGNLPPWKGDYHHDLNTQLTYWPYLTSGHWDQGEGLLDFLWHQLPRYEQFAQEFYGQMGAAIPGVAALDGSPLGGWPMYSLSPTTGLWVATAFVDQWRYSGDNRFLRARAYPFCKELATCVRGLLRPGADGKLKLPLSSSPEVHDNTLEAWLQPNSNFDLAILRKFFLDMAEMASALRLTKETDQWKGVVYLLEDLHISPEDGGLRIDAKQDLAESHRHFSHIVAIHPFGLVNVESSDADRKVIDASLACCLAKLGTKEWCGYSFAWMACIQARCGHGDEALKNLSIYADAFILRNGFHANGDQSGKGYSDFNAYRPVTLEGNFRRRISRP